jgi:hypothetical protein
VQGIPLRAPAAAGHNGHDVHHEAFHGNRNNSTPPPRPQASNNPGSNTRSIVDLRNATGFVDIDDAMGAAPHSHRALQPGNTNHHHHPPTARLPTTAADIQREFLTTASTRPTAPSRRRSPTPPRDTRPRESIELVDSPDERVRRPAARQPAPPKHRRLDTAQGSADYEPPSRTTSPADRDARTNTSLRDPRSSGVTLTIQPDTCVRVSFATPGYDFERFNAARPSMLERAIEDEARHVAQPYVEDRGSVRVYFAEGEATLNDAHYRGALGIVVDTDVVGHDSQFLIADWEARLRDPRSFAALRNFISLRPRETVVPEGAWKSELFTSNDDTQGQSAQQDSNRAAGRNNEDNYAGVVSDDYPAEIMREVEPLWQPEFDHPGSHRQGNTHSKFSSQQESRSQSRNASMSVRFVVTLAEVDGDEFESLARRDRTFDDESFRIVCRDVFDACGSGALIKLRDIGVVLQAAGRRGQRVLEVDVDVATKDYAQTQAVARQLDRWLFSDDAMLKLKLLCVRRLQRTEMVHGVTPSSIRWIANGPR